MSDLRRRALPPKGRATPAAIGKLDPGRRMIARLLPAAHLTVHAGLDEPARSRRAEQQMDYAQAGVAGPRVPEIIPEGVDALVRVKSAQCVGPALRDELMKRGARLRAEQRIVEPALRFVDVEFGRHDVVVASEDDLRARGQ